MIDQRCPKCTKEYSNVDKYCDQCGQQLEHLQIKAEDKAIGLPKAPQLEGKLKQIADHLEFYGYKIKTIPSDGKEAKILIAATHDKNNNVIFWELSPSIVFFQITLLTEKKPSLEIDHLVNEANKIATVCRVISIEENRIVKLRFEAIYTGEYAKTTFSQFFEFIENDQKATFAIPNFLTSLSN